MAEKIEASSKEIALGVGAVTILIKRLSDELFRKDLIIKFLRNHREILIDENERLEVEFERIQFVQRKYQERKMCMY